MTAVVVLGADGQLGRTLVELLGARGLRRRDADLADPVGLEHTLRGLHPRVVINCAAWNDVDGAEQRRLAALAVNAQAPAALARMARARGWRLVHYSSDYVFGDDLDRPRVETDTPAPFNFYGYSKWLGEQAVLRLHPGALVLRVANLYGNDGPAGRASLPLRFLRAAQAGAPLACAPGQRLTPTSVWELGRITQALLERRASGLFHAAGEGDCEASEFAAAVLAEAGVRGTIIARTDPRPAPRARNTVLDNARLRAAGLALPPWRVALRDYLRRQIAAGAHS